MDVVLGSDDVVVDSVVLFVDVGSDEEIVAGGIETPGEDVEDAIKK